MVTTLRIAGMHAVHAARAVHTALSGMDGITSVEVGLGIVTVEHDGHATAPILRAAVAAAGFEVTEVRESSRHLPLAEPPREV